MIVNFIVPTLNEEQNVRPLVALIESTVGVHPIPYRIIFVDDNSQDKTVVNINHEIERNDNIVLVRSPERKGLGYALLQGMREAGEGYVLFLDCDLSVSQDDLLRLLDSRSDLTMVVGGRYSAGSVIIGAPFVKVLLSKVLNKIVSLVLRLKINDVSHSFRIFKNLEQFNPSAYSHPAFFWELAAYAAANGIQVRENPITFTERRYGFTKNRMLGMAKSVILGFKVLSKYIGTGKTH